MLMDKLSPDYSTYSYTELLEVRSHIDRSKFPEKFEQVQKLIAKKRVDNDVADEEVSDNDKAMLGVLSGEWLLLISIGFAALVGYSIF